MAEFLVSKGIGIAGTAYGIGREIARLCASGSASVVISDPGVYDPVLGRPQ